MYQTKYVIKFLLRQLIMSETLRFISSYPLKQWPAKKKKGKIERLEYLENKKSVLD